MSKRQYTHRTHEQWQCHLDQHAQSQLSVKTYCQKHDLSPSNFYAWRKKLMLEATTQPNASWIALPPPSCAEPKPLASRLSTAAEISLSLPGGIELVIRSP